MTIAGSDSSAGAGIQADLKTFAALGVYGTSVITAITAQNTQGVQQVQEVSPEIVAAQIDAIVSDIGADVVKTGMLPSAAIIEVVVEKVREYGLTELVVDPVMRAKGGDSLLAEDAVAVDSGAAAAPGARRHAQPVRGGGAGRAASWTVSTACAGRPRRSSGMGARNVVVKGGHLDGPAIDLFYDGHELPRVRRAPRRYQQHPWHRLHLRLGDSGLPGQRLDVRQAVAAAKAYVTKALQQSYPLGQGVGPVAPLLPILAGHPALASAVQGPEAGPGRPTWQTERETGMG